MFPENTDMLALVLIGLLALVAVGGVVITTIRAFADTEEDEEDDEKPDVPKDPPHAKRVRAGLLPLRQGVENQLRLHTLWCISCIHTLLRRWLRRNRILRYNWSFSDYRCTCSHIT